MYSRKSQKYEWLLFGGVYSSDAAMIYQFALQL